MRAVLLTSIMLFFAASAMIARADEGPADALSFKINAIDGESVDLETYKGKVVLVVNVASRCGLTPQYAGLQATYEKYKDQGLVVLGFPCNQFAGQEPGSDAEILEFCTAKYEVTFPMFSKVDVNGEGATPLYKYLTAKDVQPAGAGDISWNFEKFLIDRRGHVVHRFAPKTKPDDKTLVAAVEAELNKK